MFITVLKATRKKKKKDFREAAEVLAVGQRKSAPWGVVVGNDADTESMVCKPLCKAFP